MLKLGNSKFKLKLLFPDQNPAAVWLFVARACLILLQIQADQLKARSQNHVERVQDACFVRNVKLNLADFVPA